MKGLWIVLLLGITPPIAESDRPWLVDELPGETWEVGASISLIGRFQSRLGQEIVLEKTRVRFQLPEDDQRFPALVDPELRSRNLWIEGKVTQAGTANEPAAVAIDSIRLGPTSVEIFDRVEAGLSSLSPGRRRAVALWGLREASVALDGAPDPELVKRAARLALDALVKEKLREGRKIEETLDLFEKSHTYLSDNARWIALVSELANENARQPEVAKAVRRLGFVPSASGWIPEATFNERIRMVRIGDRLITIDRSVLEQSIQAWKDARRSKSLLRSMTIVQYDEAAERREIQEGMRRIELLKGWGYPIRVTWIQQETERFEAWFYNDRTAYLVDGIVYDWEK